jgi:hypothetical protein
MPLRQSFCSIPTKAPYSSRNHQIQVNCEFLEDSVWYLSYKFKWVSSNNPYIQLKGIQLNKQNSRHYPAPSVPCMNLLIGLLNFPHYEHCVMITDKSIGFLVFSYHKVIKFLNSRHQSGILFPGDCNFSPKQGSGSLETPQNPAF